MEEGIVSRKRSILILLVLIIAIAAAAIIVSFALGAFNDDRKGLSIEISEPPPGWNALGQEEIDLANEGAKEIWKDNPSGTNYIDYIYTPPEGEELFGNIVVSHVLRDGWLKTEQAAIPRIFFDSIPVESLPYNDSIEEAEKVVTILNEDIIEGQGIWGQGTFSSDSQEEEFYSNIEEISVSAESMDYGGAAIHITMSGEVKYPGKDKQYRVVDFLYIFKEDYVYLISIESKGEEAMGEGSEALIDFFKKKVFFN